MDRYKMLERIGEGTFGEVHKAQNIETGQLVALKRVRLRNVEEGLPNTALREMRALQELDHPNVVRLLDFFPQASSLVLVFEFMQSDLGAVLRGARKPLAEAQVKTYMLMLLKGVEYCHENSIMHRDLKPPNLLVSPEGVLKLGDFGLARVHTHDSAAAYTHQVATRWFRAPELLFGARRYGFGVDLWAIGAIFGELLHHAPLFPGENDIDQIYRVLQVMGTPSEENWPGVRELPDYNKITFPTLKPLPLRSLLPNASPAALSLLSKFLVYDPAKRISATEALNDPYFFTEPLPVAEPHLLPLASSGAVTGASAGALDMNAPFIVPRVCAPFPAEFGPGLDALHGEDGAHDPLGRSGGAAGAAHGSGVDDGTSDGLGLGAVSRTAGSAGGYVGFGDFTTTGGTAGAIGDGAVPNGSSFAAAGFRSGGPSRHGRSARSGRSGGAFSGAGGIGAFGFGAGAVDESIWPLEDPVDGAGGVHSIGGLGLDDDERESRRRAGGSGVHGPLGSHTGGHGGGRERAGGGGRLAALGLESLVVDSTALAAMLDVDLHGADDSPAAASGRSTGLRVGRASVTGGMRDSAAPSSGDVDDHRTQSRGARSVSSGAGAPSGSEHVSGLATGIDRPSPVAPSAGKKGRQGRKKRGRRASSGLGPRVASRSPAAPARSGAHNASDTGGSGKDPERSPIVPRSSKGAGATSDAASNQGTGAHLGRRGAAHGRSSAADGGAPRDRKSGRGTGQVVSNHGGAAGAVKPTHARRRATAVEVSRPGRK